MFGIDPLTLSTLLVLAGNTVSCPAHAPTQINIVPRTEKVKYDSKQSLKQIQSYSTDTVDPYSFHGTSITQAFMRGSVGLEHKITYGQSVSPRGYGCVWYKDITVEIKIDPTIVIAKEIYKDKCMRKAVLGHELKHVKVDRRVVNKYAKSMGAKLLKALKSRGFSSGPITIDRMKEVSQKMSRVVGQVIELEYRKLGIDREELQRDVDNLEEYESIDDKCPAFERKKQKLYADLLR